MCGFEISRQPRGAALVIVMLVMAVLLMAGTAFLTISSTESQIALNEQGSAAAHVLAEAGIHKALAFYYANPSSTYAGESNTALGGGTFTISVTVPPVANCTPISARQIVAAGSVPIRGGTAQAQLQVTLDQVSYPYGWGIFAVETNRYGQELLIGHTSSVDSFDSGAGAYDPPPPSGNGTNSGQSGNVGSNGDVQIDYNSTIGGNATAGATLTRQSGVTVSGSATANAPTQSFPSVTPSQTGTTGLTVTSGTRTLPAGTYYYTNMTFSDYTVLSTSGGPVTIYVTNTSETVVSLGKNVTLGGAPGGQLTIITRSDLPSTSYVTFTAEDNFQFYGSLYGTSTNITLGNNAKIYGSMLGRRVTTRSGAAVHFDQAMSNRAVCNPGGKFTILRGTWREIIPST
jgi:Tfp pilus assembly protein PilX